MTDLKQVVVILQECFASGLFQKLTISNPLHRTTEVFKITVTPMRQSRAPEPCLNRPGGNNLFFQFEEFYSTKVRHKNVTDPNDAAKLAARLLTADYKQCDINTRGENITLLLNKKRECKVIRSQKNTPSQTNSKASEAPAQPRAHDRAKTFLIDPEAEAPWLHRLGLTDPTGHVLKDRHKKFAQINKFLEFASNLLPYLPKAPRVVDMGCGKAYLTFGLYNYLRRQGFAPKMTGIDLKADVVAYCNGVAGETGAGDLDFFAGDIADFDESALDMAVSLHACDTATDYALYHAVRLGARVIMAAPCCQHELFGQIDNNDFYILLRYGIIKERFSALLTDSLRCAILECCGYKCRAVEFIDTEHTPKNILLEAVKSNKTPGRAERERVMDMMRRFNVRPKLYALLEDRLLREDFRA